MWQDYINARNVEEVLQVLAVEGKAARIVAGATDLILEMERGVRQGIQTLIDITRIPGLDQITIEDGIIHLGPLVTHNDCVQSDIIRQGALPLALASWEVGAPQIRNRSTVAGNIITASPANDTITPLMALGAQIALRSVRGERVVPFSSFYSGFRETVMADDEMLVGISFPAMSARQRGSFIKLGLRKAQAISVVHAAMVITFAENKQDTVESAVITLGAVTPTIVRANEAESALQGQVLTAERIEDAARVAQKSARPIDDVRGSAAYRMEMVRVCVRRGLDAIRTGTEAAALPTNPIYLRKMTFAEPHSGSHHSSGAEIRSIINGEEMITRAGHDKTLLDWLREDVGLIGTKEGCGEGECGACTVFLDGAAVMSCLVPAARAHGAQIVTIEGLAGESQLHPLQQAFIDEGAVQCGYCTPGFIMAGAKLLEERPAPDEKDIRQAFTGNFCRCTGYYKIIKAVETAAKLAVE
jgi:carbon-monoxide dehydrogenase medium subunit